MSIAQHIERLEEINNTFALKGESTNKLFNKGTMDVCQVFEYVSTSVIKELYIDIPEHVHKISDKLFFVVSGTLTFIDGTTLQCGEYKLVPKGVKHGCCLSPTGKAIVIVRPPEVEYETNN